MTIKRQYSLPNCTLILEGLSDSPSDSGSTTGIMSTLVNAECHFLGCDRVLSGGRGFFENLVNSVSAYAQEFLSGLHHPQATKDDSNLVRIEKIDDINRHRLTLSNSDNQTDSSSTSTKQVDLTTVQLFDLIEAIDRFFADTRTLPDLALELQPLSRRYRKAEEPFVERATPAALGLAGLAACAFAFSLIPPPAVRKPEPKPTATPTQTLPNTPSSTNKSNNGVSNPQSDRPTPLQTPSSSNNNKSNSPTNTSPTNTTSPNSSPSPTSKTNSNPNPNNAPAPINLP